MCAVGTVSAHGTGRGSGRRLGSEAAATSWSSGDRSHDLPARRGSLTPGHGDPDSAHSTRAGGDESEARRAAEHDRCRRQRRPGGGDVVDQHPAVLGGAAQRPRRRRPHRAATAGMSRPPPSGTERSHARETGAAGDLPRQRRRRVDTVPPCSKPRPRHRHDPGGADRNPRRDGPSQERRRLGRARVLELVDQGPRCPVVAKRRRHQHPGCGAHLRPGREREPATPTQQSLTDRPAGGTSEHSDKMPGGCDIKRYSVLGTRYSVLGTKTRQGLQRTRYEVRGTRYEVRGTRHEARGRSGTEYRIPSTATDCPGTRAPPCRR